MSDNVVQLPVRPSEADPAETLPKYQPKADWAPAPAPAREKISTDGLGLWLKIQSAFAGASLLDATPPALLLVWERHRTAAKAWDTRLLRWPRWAWGAVHVTMIAPVLYFMVWATDSGPKALAALLVIVTTLLWLPHLTITITL